MKYIFEYLKRADKRRLVIYIFSYAIYRLTNNIFSNSVLYLLNEESFRQRWTSNSVPCGDTPHLFLILFQAFKILLFIVLLRQIKRKTDGLISEFFIAYFIYDLVYILSFIWNLIPFPINLHTWWMLISSGQIFLSHYFLYLDIIFAALWTSLFFIVLYRQNKLSIKFLLNRLALIPISVFLVSWTIYFIRQLF